MQAERPDVKVNLRLDLKGKQTNKQILQSCSRSSELRGTKLARVASLRIDPNSLGQILCAIKKKADQPEAHRNRSDCTGECEGLSLVFSWSGQTLFWRMRQNYRFTARTSTSTAPVRCEVELLWL